MSLNSWYALCLFDVTKVTFIFILKNKFPRKCYFYFLYAYLYILFVYRVVVEKYDVYRKLARKYVNVNVKLCIFVFQNLFEI